MEEGRERKMVPAWVEALYKEKFFVGCSVHSREKKSERNMLCLECGTSVCAHCCISYHRYHHLLQVRRYVYHDVLRLHDLHQLIDCSNVQAYTINGAKVVFIKKRAQNRQFRGSGNYCTSCRRCLQQPYVHCSLACKVDFAVKYEKDLSPSLMEECSRSSVVDWEESSWGSSGSENMEPRDSITVARKKRSRRKTTSATSSRRKGIPHRSPMG